LDAYAGLESLRSEVAARYRRWAALRAELDGQQRDDAERLQLIDILQFQIEELERANLSIGEEERLGEERRRRTNTEKISGLCAEGFALTYEENDSGIARIGQAQRRVEELAEYDSRFRSYLDGLESARALLEDLAFSLRDFAERLEFSPARLAEVESRLA